MVILRQTERIVCGCMCTCLIPFCVSPSQNALSVQVCCSRLIFSDVFWRQSSKKSSFTDLFHCDSPVWSFQQKLSQRSSHKVFHQVHLTKPSSNTIPKTLPAKSSDKFLQQNLSTKSSGKLLQQNLTADSSNDIIPRSLLPNSCSTILNKVLI